MAKRIKSQSARRTPFQRPASVFISYSQQDRAIVYLIVSLLKITGISVFWDQAIEPGAKWEDVLLSWLSEADIALVFWSSRSAKSEWVQTEYELLASQTVKPLIPVLLDRSPLPPKLQQRQAIDMGRLLDAWVTRDNVDDLSSEVSGSEIGRALFAFLSGQIEPGILFKLDAFDIHCALMAIGRPLDFGRYLAWRGEGIPSPLVRNRIYCE